MNGIEQVENLLTLARRDLRAAEVLCDRPEVGEGIVGFHAQQATEKALKAWLTFLGIAYPRTHDLSLLLYKLEEGGADVARWWELLDLNPFAVQFRYEILDDEPLDHQVTLARVKALLNEVEGLIEESSSPGGVGEALPSSPP